MKNALAVKNYYKLYQRIPGTFWSHYVYLGQCSFRFIRCHTPTYP